jgi:anti-sigma factor ChrR (cupin superfamily)
MKHSVPLEEMRERAALYALGALTQHEAHAFESHLAESCEFCETELQEFTSVADALAFAPAEQEPRAELGTELLARINQNSAPCADGSRKIAQNGEPFSSIRATDGDWKKVDEGIFMKSLYFDNASGIATSLVRMSPGTELPAHQHNGVEQFYILEGDCSVRGEALGPGDYHRAAAGSIHETTFTVKGTMFLLVAPSEFTVLQAT